MSMRKKETKAEEEGNSYLVSDRSRSFIYLILYPPCTNVMASACVLVIHSECDSICIFRTLHGLKNKVISILLCMLCNNYHACRGTIALTDLTDPVKESSWKGFVTAIRVCGFPAPAFKYWCGSHTSAVSLLQA